MNDDRLALIESYNEACAAVANVERIVLLMHLPPELHDDVRLSNPYDDASGLFGLLDDGAVRIHRDGPFAFAERYVDEELVGEGVLVFADGRWRWVEL